MLKILATTALAAMLVLDLGGASPAFAIKVQHEVVKENGNHVYTYYDDDENVLSEHFYDKNHKHILSIYHDSDPNPEGGDSGLVDFESIIEEGMKNGGAGGVKENNFLETTLGQTLIKHRDTGSIVPFHNPVPIDSSPVTNTGHATNPAANGLSEDPFAETDFELEQNQGSSGGGWYDPMGGGMVEQMIKNGKKNKGKGSKGSGDAASDAHNPGYDFPADPELVNPVPESLSAAKPRKKKVQHVPAPALIKKGKGLTGNLSSYPDIPNLPSPAAATNQNRRSGFNTAVGMQPRAAGKFQTMLGRGGSRRGVSRR